MEGEFPQTKEGVVQRLHVLGDSSYYSAIGGKKKKKDKVYFCIVPNLVGAFLQSDVPLHAE